MSPPRSAAQSLPRIAATLWRSEIADALLAALATYLVIRALNAPLNLEAASIPGQTRRGVFDDPAGFTIVWVLLFLCLVVTRQRFTVLALFSGIGAAGFVAMRTKLELLRAPLMPADLAFATDLGFLGGQTSVATVVVPDRRSVRLRDLVDGVPGAHGADAGPDRTADLLALPVLPQLGLQLPLGRRVVALVRLLGHGHPRLPRRVLQASRRLPDARLPGVVEQDDFTVDHHAERNPHQSDTASFGEALAVLEESEEPALVHVVTMQNHQPFDGWYDDPPAVEGLVGTADEAGDLATWLGGLESSSLALRDFTTALTELERPTIVVYYGDHYPAVLPPELLEANTAREVRTTPVVLWASTGVADPGRELGTVGVYDTVPLAASMVGAPLPPFYRLLQHVRTDLGVVGPGSVITPDGTELAPDELSPEQQQLLQDYRLVQYDLSVGERYGVDALWYDWQP